MLQLWGNASDHSLYKLQVIQNKILKIITNAPMYTRLSKIHEDLDVETVKEYTTKLTKNFYEKCKNSKYQTISNIGSYDYQGTNKYKMPKDFILGQIN